MYMSSLNAGHHLSKVGVVRYVPESHSVLSRPPPSPRRSITLHPQTRPLSHRYICHYKPPRVLPSGRCLIVLQNALRLAEVHKNAEVLKIT